jgi:EAL domain-containing protein (putative c-di-GMP-specific phosphodiesterase class I)
MSLRRQVWLGTTLFLAVLFCACLAINGLSARAYLQQQLAIKNVDNARVLALLLSQQWQDPALREETLNAQFSTGLYEAIEVTDSAGDQVFYRGGQSDITGAPAWFAKWLPIEVDRGIATITDGSRPLGTVAVSSHSKFAYHQLWRSTLLLSGAFLLAALAAGLLGNYFLTRMLRPLEAVAEQAKAIGARRFNTLDEPRAPEFRKLFDAVNRLSVTVRDMLAKEGRQREQIERSARNDKVTGLLGREPFVQSLDGALQGSGGSSTGSVGMVRIRGLARLNQIYGRKAIDSMLKDAGSHLNRLAMQNSGWAIARLNGSDLIVHAPRAQEAAAATESIRETLREVLRNHGLPDQLRLPAASTVYEPGDSVSELMTRLDGALLAADTEEASSVSVAHRGDIQMKPVREQMDDWRRVFVEAFHQRAFALASFPVVGLEGEIIHWECPVALEWRGESLVAGDILPWISRLEMSGELDKHVVDLALRKIGSEPLPVCINLSARSLLDPGFLGWISERLSSHPGTAGHLWVEIPAAAVFRHLDRFRLLAARAREYGSRVGIDNIADQVADLGRLQDTEVDFLKLDSAVVTGIDGNPANQALVKTLCSVGHAIGLQVLAGGVQRAEEWQTLRELGCDGATGPGISR